MSQWIGSLKFQVFSTVCIILLGYYIVNCDLRKQVNLNLKKNVILQEKGIDQIGSEDFNFDSPNRKTEEKYPVISNSDGKFNRVGKSHTNEDKITSKKIIIDSIKIEDKETAVPEDQEHEANTNNDAVDYQVIEEDEDYAENYDSYYSGNQLPDCSEKDDKRDPLLIISTIDGYISGISYITGKVIWSHRTSSEDEPLLSSSMSKLEVRSRGEWVRLIPSMNGGIYRFDGENVETLPVTADTFLHSSFKFNDDTIFAGGKFSEILGIHPHTGEVKYACDKRGCPIQRTSETNRNTLVVRRISYSVRAIDPSVGNERWNFSVGQHEINIVSSGCESRLKDSELDSMPSLHFVLPEGKIIAMNENSQILWQQKLPSPIVSAWSLKNEDLEEINLFSSNSIPALLPEGGYEDSKEKQKEPMLYVGIHQGQLYVQENENLKKRSPGAQYINNMSQGFPKIQWQPYLATALSRTPIIHHGSNNHPLLLDYDKKEKVNDLVIKHTYDYPFDNGYYLFGDDFDLLLNDSDYWSLKKDEIDSVYSPKTFGEKILYYLNRGSVSLRTWSVIWVPLICVVVGALYVRQYIRTERAINQIRANDMVFSMVVFILHNIFRENQQVLQMLQRLGLHIPTLPEPPTTPMYALTEEGTNETPQTPSTPSDRVTERQDSCFVSRFTSDFETIGRLGQGGFGVVLRVKKKLDENEYAVKRIVLPSKEKSAERVKREVRALAKLNHSNIVRYYNSWLETPPVDFVQEDDKFWKASDTFAPSFDDFTEQREKIKSEENQTSGVLSQSINTGNIQDLRGVNFDNFDNIPSKVYEDDDSFEIAFEEQSDIEGENVDDTDDDDDDGGNSAWSENNISFSNSEIFKVQQKYKRKERTQSDSVVFMTSSNEDQKDRRLSTSISISSNSCRGHIKNQKRPFSLDIKEFNSSLYNNTDNIKKILENNPPVINPKTYLFIQMELCKEESLKEWLTANRERDQNWIYSVFNDIVHAVEYVHDRALMHRDLKPSNIFFSLDGEIKIGDFGLVTNIDEENDIALTPLDDKSIISKNLQKQKTLNVGTQLYMSPEQLSGQSYTYKVDIYSLGLIFFEMLVSFSTEMERLDVMRKARDKEFPRDFITKFPDVTNLLKLTLHRDPSKRPTTRGIRLRDPLKVFQKSIENIMPEEHFHLIRPRGQGHVRVHSGSQIILQSSSGSP
ncbi:UNVERIFIED_CONTAM: hypothetical protein RMT77_006922 [Armadillidium vulgare]